MDKIQKFVAIANYIIKTHDSESRGQEEAAIIRETKNMRPLSELKPFRKSQPL